MDTRFMRMTLVALALLGAAAVAQAAWLGAAGTQPAEPSVTTTDAGGGRTLVEIVVPGVETETVVIDGRSYAKVMLPGHVQLLERGSPQLPYITTSLIIADGGTPRVRVLATEYREYASDPVEPSKGVILRSVDPRTVAYEFGPAYRGGVFPAETTVLGEPYIVRDFRGVNVRLYPVQWDADRGVLRVLTSATYEVVTEGSGGINAKKTSFDEITPAFDAIYAGKFANYDRGAKYLLNPSEGPMLIVCYDAFVGAMQPFADWKQQRGLDVELITTSSVGGTVAGIQAAIQQRYDSAEGLAFVVLVGDGAQCPHYSGAYEGANDDTHYVRLEGGDVYPDALISRISAVNATEVSTQVTKFVSYERDVAGPADWTHMATGIASNEGSPTDAVRCDWLRDDLLAYNFTDVDRIYQGQGGTTAGISTAVNAGRSLINYIGHGSGTSWSSVYFANSHVTALTNTAWPWIIDVSCLNGGISAIGVSFAEAWMRAGSPAQPYGAVGMYSASTSTPWVPPCVMQAEAVELLCAESANLLGVLCHAGIMAVLDQYGTTGTGLQLVEQYNLFGDCSLMVRTASPHQMAVAHAPVVPLFTPSFAVDTGVADVVVTLSGNGVIYGTGTTDAGGHVDLVMANPVDTVGDLTLTAFGYNQETYRIVLPAVVPANVTVEPISVPVGVATPVTVTVTDPDTGGGMDDVLIDIVGFGFSCDPVQTDAAGQVTITVTAAVGENLTVRGQEIGAGYDLFTHHLPVTGAPALGNPTVVAGVPSIGMTGTLTPHLEGEITASLRNADFTLRLIGGGLDFTQDVVGTSVTVHVTPTELSTVQAVLMKAGYYVYTQDIPVVAAYGTLAGTVVDEDAANAPLAGARVVCFEQGADPSGPPLFDLVTGADGSYAWGEDLAVGYYDLYVTKFGYLPLQETYFLLFGTNSHQIAVGQAPSGVLTGTVTASEDGSPLEATIRVFRSDTGTLFNEVTSDPETGVYTTGALPYFDYQVTVRSYRRIPQTVDVTIDDASVQQLFALEPTEGDVLILDDNSTALLTVPDKYDEDGVLIAPGYEVPAGRAAAAIVADLEDLGFTTTLEPAAVSDPADWPLYDLVFVSSGANTGPLGNTTLRANLTAFNAAGGKLFVEGGEIAYDLQYSDVTFLQNVLRVLDWNGDSSGNVTVTDPDHPVMSVPNPITGPITCTYSGYGDADHVVPTAAGHRVGAWSSYPTEASVITDDDNDNPVAGQFVFFLFNYSAMGAGRKELLHNAVSWLIASEVVDPTPVVEDVVPTALALDGNFPNPFNPMTVIRYRVPATQDIELAIFDLRGQKIRTLVRDVVPAGVHEATWRGLDDAGRQVASGTYFYRLTGGGESLVGRLVLLK
ncbi:MAG TPA: C25 family cysteine peptidase [Candidatus Krumholzibacteria bacterium]|nr:C25 family cysteine peptidase [Candidatus Krumholzibacteria bacterium]HPD72185.1 C25 family cysteine peptidase [Candidatus Krumholzibacteria bacterium]HRY40883.1 C25 family cysteine peptidase [Candidatus Krumholzibacteria bacterium]